MNRTEIQSRRCAVRVPGANRMRATRGFTLVEMLVATTVTLLVIFAMAQAFATVSETIRTGRATMEMAGGIRQVTWRLQQDLEGVTAPVRPWLQSSWGHGYFEWYDGPSNDLDADGDGLFDYDPNNTTTNKNLSLGDRDDVLMFTARRIDAPFLGRVNSNPIQSEYAEIAWWIEPEDVNLNSVQDAGEYYRLHRRAMLIRPDLNGPGGYLARLPLSSSQYYSTSSQTDLQDMYDDVVAFINSNDISVRFRRQENGTNVELFIVANSLSDLTIRQNRFCHDPVVYLQLSNNQYAYLNQSGIDGLYPHPVHINDSFHPNINTTIRAAFALRRAVQSGVFQGEDVMLPNLLAFDVRGYDPNAIVSIHFGKDGQWGESGTDDDGNNTTDGQDYIEAGWPGTDDEVVGPGDPGYGAGGNTTIANGRSILGTGFGAYVDLNYFAKYGITGLSATKLSGADSAKSKMGLSMPARSGTYDTWPFDYEIDGLNQDDISPNPILADEGTDGFDDDSANGIDDEGERETAAPYYYPLHGIEVRVRVIEPDTRQVRQTAVTTNFVPE